jgi:hypothetical protein
MHRRGGMLAGVGLNFEVDFDRFLGKELLGEMNGTTKARAAMRAMRGETPIIDAPLSQSVSLYCRSPALWHLLCRNEVRSRFGISAWVLSG